MNIALTPQLELLIKEQVSRGLYSNVSEFIREAVRDALRRNKQELLQLELVEARKQYENGEYEEMNFEKAIRNAKKKAGVTS